MKFIAIAALAASASAVRFIEDPESLVEKENKRWVFNIDEIKKGPGHLCEKGMTAEVHYTGSLKDNGKIFDTSISRDLPFKFTVGSGAVIPCWDQAMPKLHVGVSANVTCPSDIAYGERGTANIPPNADLMFNIQVLKCYKEL